MQDPPAVEPHQEMKRSLEALLRAFQYASDLDCDPWDFAVEIQILSDLGLTTSDLRWLSCKGYVQQAREVGLPGHDARQFGPTGPLSITTENCYILTESGVNLAKEVLRTTSSFPGQGADSLRTSKPRWDSDRHQLRLGKDLIKCFKLPSPNQETVLAAFEEEDWPPRITDPLPPVPEIDPKRRLQDTIKSLNRCQKTSVLRFSGDGTGEGVLWQIKHQRRRNSGRPATKPHF